MTSESVKMLVLALVPVVLILTRCAAPRDVPVTVVPPDQPLPRATKGYELYSWHVNREWYFSLLTGTNRIKSYQEITAGENVIGDAWIKLTVRGVDDLVAVLDQLPPGTHLVWSGPRALKGQGIKPGDLALPSKSTRGQVEDRCHELGIRLLIAR